MTQLYQVAAAGCLLGTGTAAGLAGRVPGSWSRRRWRCGCGSCTRPPRMAYWGCLPMWVSDVLPGMSMTLPRRGRRCCRCCGITRARCPAWPTAGTKAPSQDRVWVLLLACGGWFVGADVIWPGGAVIGARVTGGLWR